MRRAFGIGAAICLAGAACCAAQQKPNPPKRHAGEDARAPNRPPAGQAPAVNPRLPKPVQAEQLAFRAEDLQDQGKFDQAAALMQQAADLVPDDWVMWNRAGWAHLDNGQAAPALKAFETARKAAPPGTPLEGGLVISRFALGNPKELMELVQKLVPAAGLERARTVVAKGLAAKPRSGDWNFALGYLYARVIGNSSRALEPMESVVAEDPKNAEAWLILVEANQVLNRGPQEDAAAVKYLQLAPETVDAYRLRAQRFFELRDIPNAVAEYQAGILKYPLEPDLYYQLARVHERAGDPRQADAVYRKLVSLATERRLEPLLFQARMQLANFQARRRDWVDAEKFYREAAARPDSTVSTWNTWGALLALSGKFPEAAAALETAAAKDEKERGAGSPSVRDEALVNRYHAAVCRLAAGQRQAAVAGLEGALKLRSEARTSPELEANAFLDWLDKPEATLQLVYQRSDERWAKFSWRRELQGGEADARGRFSAGAAGWRAVLQQVRRLFPTCWPADYALARLDAAGGYTGEALKLLEKAAVTRPDWWALHYALGEYYARRRDRERGIPALQKTVKLAPENRQARVYLSLLSNVKPDDLDKDQ